MNRIWVLFGVHHNLNSILGPLAVDSPEQLSRGLSTVPIVCQKSESHFFSVVCGQQNFRPLMYAIERTSTVTLFSLICFFSKFIFFFNLIGSILPSPLQNKTISQQSPQWLLKSLAKYIGLKFYLDSFLYCNCTVKPLFLPPLLGVFGWLTAMPSAISDFARMHPFFFLQCFDPVHIPS